MPFDEKLQLLQKNEKKRLPCDDDLQLLQDNYREKKRLEEIFFICLYKNYQFRFINWAINTYRNRQDKEELLRDAEDAFQEGMAAWYITLDKGGFMLTSKIKTYLYRICINHLLNIFRDRARAFGYIQDPLEWYELIFKILFEENLEKKEVKKLLEDGNSINFHVIEKVLSWEVKDILDKLPQKYRQILILRFLVKSPKREIANKLGISERKIKQAIIETHNLAFDFMQPPQAIEVHDNFGDEQERKDEERKRLKCQIEVFVETLWKRLKLEVPKENNPAVTEIKNKKLKGQEEKALEEEEKKKKRSAQIILLSHFYEKMEPKDILMILEIKPEEARIVYDIKYKFDIEYEVLYNSKCKPK